MNNDDKAMARKELQERYLRFFSKETDIKLSDIGPAIDCGRTREGDARRLRELAKNSYDKLIEMAKFMEDNGIG